MNFLCAVVQPKGAASLRPIFPGLEAVADPGFGGDVVRGVVHRFQFLAEMANEDSQVLGLLNAIGAPNRGE